jgi:hypothetical protein
MTDDKCYVEECLSLSKILAEKSYSDAEKLTIWIGNFYRVEDELRRRIETLERELADAEDNLMDDAFTYRWLRDTANADEIKYILLANVLPDEIDRRARHLQHEGWEPGSTPERGD